MKVPMSKVEGGSSQPNEGPGASVLANVKRGSKRESEEGLRSEFEQSAYRQVNAESFHKNFATLIGHYKTVAPISRAGGASVH
jgi:hypothetical protein